MRTLRSIGHFFAVTALAGVAACGPSISSDSDPTIPVPKGATVAFVGGRSEGGQNLDPAVQNDIVHRRIQTAIMQQLTDKGFRVVENPEEADFVVRYFVGVQKNTEYVTTTTGVAGPAWGGYGWGYGYGWGWGWGGGVTTTQPVTTTDASFVVDLVQRTTGRTAWRGIWQGTPGKQAPSQEQVNAAATKIFKSAPTAF